MLKNIAKNPLKAIFFMALWSCFYVTTMSLNKFVSADIPTPLILFYRGIIALMWLSPLLIRNGGFLLLKKSSIPRLHLMRGLLTALVTGCTYYSYRYLPLGLATIIGFSGPLFTSVIASLVLKESLGPKKLLCILIGYLGVFVVVRPGTIDWSFDMGVALGIALLGNILIGGVIVLLKIISKEDDTLTILFFNTLIPACFWGVYATTCFVIPEFRDLMILLAIGLSGLSLQFCYAKAIVFEDASFVAPLEYMRILLALPVSAMLFGEEWNHFILLGGALVIAGTYGLLRIENKQGLVIKQ